MKHTLLLQLTLSLALLPVHSTLADEYTEAPPNIQTALFMKVLGFHKTLAKDATLYVLAADTVQAEMKKMAGTSFGANSKLAEVDGGPTLPARKYDILYIGDPAQAAAALAYTEQHQALSITGVPGAFSQGTALSVLVSKGDGKPKVVIRAATSKREKVDWNPALLKIAIVAD